MPKLYVEIDNIELYENLKDKDLEGIILPFSIYSTIKHDNYQLLLDKVLNDKPKFKICLNIEKIFDDEMLNDFSHLIKPYLDKIDFMFISDYGVRELLLELGYNKLIYRAPSYLTNIEDIKLNKEFFSSIVLSSEISYEELKEIIKNINFECFVDAFGMNMIFYSRRLLLTNYFNYKNLDNNPMEEDYYIKEETRDNKQRIIEDENSTLIYEDHYYYLYEELNEYKDSLNLIIHLPFMDINNSLKIIDLYLKKNYDNNLFNLNLPLGKGAYQNKLILRKGEEDE